MKTLGDLIEKNDVDERFFLKNEKLEKMEYLKGSKKKLTVLKSYNKPNYIYIKLNSNEEYVLYVKKNDYVYKGTILAKTKGKFTKSLFSSVSGFIEDIDIIDNFL